LVDGTIVWIESDGYVTKIVIVVFKIFNTDPYVPASVPAESEKPKKVQHNQKQYRIYGVISHGKLSLLRASDHSHERRRPIIIIVFIGDQGCLELSIVIISCGQSAGETSAVVPLEAIGKV
jgi:hypothetical protein